MDLVESSDTLDRSEYLLDELIQIISVKDICNVIIDYDYMFLGQLDLSFTDNKKYEDSEILCPLPDDRFISGTIEGNIIVFDTINKRIDKIFKLSDDYITHIITSNQIYDIETIIISTGTQLFIFDLDFNIITIFKNSYTFGIVEVLSKNTIVTKEGYSTIAIFDLNNNKLNKLISFDTGNAIMSLKIIHNPQKWLNNISRSVIITADSGGSLSFWDPKTGTLYQTFNESSNMIYSMIILSDDKIVTTTSNTIHIWNPLGRSYDIEIKTEYNTMKTNILPDGYIIGMSTFQLYIIDSITGTIYKTIQHGYFLSNLTVLKSGKVVAYDRSKGRFVILK